MNIFLFLIWSWDAHAAPNDAPAAPPVSEAVAAQLRNPAQKALDDLGLLWSKDDFAGVRTQGLLAQAELNLPEAGYYAACARLALGDRTGAHQELAVLQTEYRDTPLAHAATLTMADSFMDGLPNLAANHYRTYLTQQPEGVHRDRALAGVALAQVKVGQFSDAQATLKSAELPIPSALDSVLSEPPAWRSPSLATALAIVPGAGHLYAGAPKQALSAFVVNAVFASAITVSARAENWGTVGVLGFFGAGFYAGNLYGAGEAAIRTNRGHQKQIERSFENANLVDSEVVLPEERWVRQPETEPPVESPTGE